MKFHRFAFLTALAAVLTGTAVSAAEDDAYDWNTPKQCNNVSISVDGNHRLGKVAIRPLRDKFVNCNFQQSGKEELRAFSMHQWFSLKPDEWLNISFTFEARSKRKGKVILRINPPGGYQRTPSGDLFKNPNICFICVAKVESREVRIKNGNFTASSLSDWGIPKQKVDDPHKECSVERDAKAPGGRYARIWRGIAQEIDVKPGQIITISLSLKGSDSFIAKY